jgi:hypothetical protein
MLRQMNPKRQGIRAVFFSLLVFIMLFSPMVRFLLGTTSGWIVYGA